MKRELLTGFEAIAGPGARCLVLGTLPSRRSLQTGEYYAHSRNAFWPIMADLFGIEEGLPYEQRKRVLVNNGLAVWDVLAASVRPGSLDASIDAETSRANNFEQFIGAHPEIATLFFNGQAAARLFRRLVAPKLETRSNMPERHVLPSTSPAHAAMPYKEKLKRWHIVADVLSRSTST